MSNEQDESTISHDDTPVKYDVGPDGVEKPRRIRSFVRRQGRLTDGQQRALDEYWSQYGLTLDAGLLNFSELFGRESAVILEIGFGNGSSLVAMAKSQPEKDFIGIEVHRPGVGSLINEAQSQGVTNIKVFHEDAIEVLASCIPDKSLMGFQLFFPDPWHKTRHNKRRIVTPEFIKTIHQKLKSGATIHMATDWQHYAKQMLKVLTADHQIKNTVSKDEAATTGGYAPRPDYRPKTKFEARGERLGHGVWDLIFSKI
ncbi:MAG: tRNA (guanosine(46)-N7)-methyltransferase TrmB [Moraxellaceae bacterium]|nr:MAG: tRNA (guanosine(46)-N7)-methyltransferase TrmB [Moraxellaceae bacterium]